jgi:hypothetical protein
MLDVVVDKEVELLGAGRCIGCACARVSASLERSSGKEVELPAGLGIPGLKHAMDLNGYYEGPPRLPLSIPTSETTWPAFRPPMEMKIGELRSRRRQEASATRGLKSNLQN